MVATQMSGVADLRHKSGVYCFVHRASLMCYVGSSNNIEERRKAHFEKAKSGKGALFHKALREFGPNSFDFEVLEFCHKDKLLEKEKFWIGFYSSAGIGGFNIYSTPTQYPTGKLSEATRARMSFVHKGKTMSVETRARMSLAAKNLPSDLKEKQRLARIGIKRSPEFCAKLSKIAKARFANRVNGK